MEQKTKRVLILSVNNENISQFDNIKLMMDLEQTIKKSIRKSDSFSMTNVNEFEISVPSCSEDLATKIGERVLKNFMKNHTVENSEAITFATKELAYSA